MCKCRKSTALQTQKHRNVSGKGTASRRAMGLSPQQAQQVQQQAQQVQQQAQQVQQQAQQVQQQGNRCQSKVHNPMRI